MMRRRALAVCTVVALLGVAALAAPAAADRQGANPVSPFWHPMQPATAGGSAALLSGVTAVGPDDVWAVGSQRHGRAMTTLAEHFDGASWSVVPTPIPRAASFSALSGVAAIGSKNVWAVGTFFAGRSFERLLVEHWNGSGWHRVPTPSLGGGASILTAVSAVATDEIWAVGYYVPTGAFSVQTLAMRWNGSEWSVIHSAAPKGVSRGFFGVDARTPDNGWAVGLTGRGDTGYKSLAEHWNGHSWQQAQVPSPGTGFNELTSVSVVGPGNAWAVGAFSNGPRASFPLVVHRTGGVWTRVQIPGLGVGTRLLSVSGDAPDDVWAVGVASGGSNALLVHWDGDTWSRYSGPGSVKTQLTSVTTHGTTATWAVGVHSIGFHDVAVHEHWNGHAWVR